MMAFSIMLLLVIIRAERGMGVELLGHKVWQVLVAKGEYIELVGIGDAPSRGAWRCEWIGDGSEEVVVIGDVQGMLGHTVDDHVLSESYAFQLGRNQKLVNVGGGPVELTDDIQEQALLWVGVARKV